MIAALQVSIIEELESSSIHVARVQVCAEALANVQSQLANMRRSVRDFDSYVPAGEEVLGSAQALQLQPK